MSRLSRDSPSLLSVRDISDVNLVGGSHPVLIAVEGFQSLYCQTQYRDPHYQPIKPWRLSLPRLLLECASGKKSFVRCRPLLLLQLHTNEFDL